MKCMRDAIDGLEKLKWDMIFGPIGEATSAMSEFAGAYYYDAMAAIDSAIWRMRLANIQLDKEMEGPK